MNKLVIPPSPNWYQSYTLACAPDNTVVYGTRNEIIVILPKPAEEPNDVRLIAGIHDQRITCVAVSPNWGNPHKYAVSTAEDNLVRLLDIETCTSKLFHVGHTTRSDKVVGATFSGSDRVISVSEEGFIIIWRLGANQLTSLSDLLGSRAKVTCISSNPHATWMVAFGFKKGSIRVADLRRNGRILYSLYGHDNPVISLSWCPTPYNIFPKKIKTSKEPTKLYTDNAPTVSKAEHCTDDELADKGVAVDDVLNDKDEGLGETDSSSENLCLDAESTSQAEQVEIKINDVSEKDLEKPYINTSTSVMKKTSNPSEDASNGSSMEVHEPEVHSEDSVKMSLDDLDEDNQDTQVEKNEVEELTIGASAISADDSVIKEETLIREQSEEVQVEQNEVVQSTIKESVNNTDDTATEEETLVMKQNEEVSEESQPEIKTSETLEDKVEEQGPSSLFENVSEASTEGVVKYEPEVYTKEFLLASSARGTESIKIWRAGTDGLLQTELFIPRKPNRGHRSKRADDKSWVTVCWVTPKDLLCSSYKGELLHFRLPPVSAKKGEKPKKFRVIHGDHHENLFCIAAPIRKHESVDDEDFRDKNLLNVWTTGKDRFILNTSLSADHKTLASYPTIGGIVSCMAASHLDPSRIAVGIADSCRMWDLSRPHLQRIAMTQLSERTQIKVGCLAWHPQKEGTLAFGSDLGRVGLFDTNNPTKVPTFLVQASNAAVHKLEWGPLNADREVLGLYAITKGNLLVYDVNKPLIEPAKVDVGNANNFAWKSDYSVLAVGTKTGDVILYSAGLKLMSKLLLQGKTVRWMAWHPEGFSEENWLAVATNYVVVYDCSEIIKNPAEPKNYEECTVAMFTDHTHLVHCLTWSPHEGGMLASVGDDGTVLVWNVKTKTLLHTCLNPNCDTLFTIIWSNLDPDYVITGGRDCMIRIWKLSENPPQPNVTKKQRQKGLKLTEGLGLDEENKPEVQKIDPAVKKSRCLLTGVAQAQSYRFPIDGLDDCRRLFDFCCRKPENGNYNREKNHIDLLDLFGTKEDLHNLLFLEKTSHQIKTQPLYLESISMWQGDIAETIKASIASGHLNPWLIAAAPMVSFNLWQEACQAYAKQLSELSDTRAVEAAYFYLVCHKVEEAINVLCNASYFREALAVAKCRLAHDDPLINTILLRWAKVCTSVGNFEVAAECYLAMEQVEEAAKVLFRRSDLQTLRFCAELARHCDNKDMLDAVMFRLNAFGSTEDSQSEEPEVVLMPRSELELKMNESNIKPSDENDQETYVSNRGLPNEVNYVKYENNRGLTRAETEVDENNRGLSLAPENHASDVVDEISRGLTIAETNDINDKNNEIKCENSQGLARNQNKTDDYKYENSRGLAMANQNDELDDTKTEETEDGHEKGDCKVDDIKLLPKPNHGENNAGDGQHV